MRGSNIEISWSILIAVDILEGDSVRHQGYPRVGFCDQIGGKEKVAARHTLRCPWEATQGQLNS